jgi:hypothetical protein
MIRIFRLPLSCAAILGTICFLQSCTSNLTAADIAGSYISNGNGAKITLNPDGTGSNVGNAGNKFEIKYRVENNKILTQEYMASSPDVITNITLAKENDGNLCITDPQYPMKICYVKQK